MRVTFVTAGLGSHRAVKCDRNDCFLVTFSSHSGHNFHVVSVVLVVLCSHEGMLAE